MDEPDREALRADIDRRLKELDERLDRLFAFELPIGATVEERVEQLERHVTAQRRLLIHAVLLASSNKREALERFERAVENLEKQS